MVNDSEADVRKRVSEEFTYDIRNECISGALDMSDWKLIFVDLHMAIPMFPILIIIWIIRRAIITKLNFKSMSEKTFRTHSQLLKVND